MDVLADRARQFPIGASISGAALDADLHGVLARLRQAEPVSWVPALGGWLVTGRDHVVEAMRDAARFTVDDPRFSTGRVLGPSMLSLDGPEHARHRQPFVEPFRAAEVRTRFAPGTEDAARSRVASLTSRRRAELRGELAGPLAVDVMQLTLDLAGVDATTLLAWYADIVAATAAISDGDHGHPVPAAVGALADQVHQVVARSDGLLASAARVLAMAEVVSNTGVMLFGGLETSEGATANAFVHLLTTPGLLDTLRNDPTLIPQAVDESLRLEPSVVRLDRYARVDVMFGDAPICEGDFVMLSIAAANRDPAAFNDPDRFDLCRENARQHVTFAHGPHACPGMHLARFETEQAIAAAIDAWPGLRLDPARPPRLKGTIFRKPDAVHVLW